MKTRTLESMKVTPSRWPAMTAQGLGFTSRSDLLSQICPVSSTTTLSLPEQSHRCNNQHNNNNQLSNSGGRLCTNYNSNSRCYMGCIPLLQLSLLPSTGQ